MVDQLATKAGLGRELAGMESHLTDKLASQQRWYVGLLFVAAGLAVAAVKLI